LDFVSFHLNHYVMLSTALLETPHWFSADKCALLCGNG